VGRIRGYCCYSLGCKRVRRECGERKEERDKDKENENKMGKEKNKENRVGKT